VKFEREKRRSFVLSITEAMLSRMSEWRVKDDDVMVDSSNHRPGGNFHGVKRWLIRKHWGFLYVRL